MGTSGGTTSHSVATESNQGGGAELACQRVGELESLPAGNRWLIEGVWAAGGVGIVGGSPKTGKTWFATELAVSVASGTPALGVYRVPSAGPVLFYPAEDDPRAIRDRVAGLCAARSVMLADLDLHVITSERLLLDAETDRLGLEATLERVKPKLLLLDPLVRLHGGDENYTGHIAALLGYLRVLSRRFNLAVMLTHHISKRSGKEGGQALRGSSDLHAWGDSNAYLRRESSGSVILTLEHRSHPAPQPVELKLVTSGCTTRFEVAGLAHEESDRPVQSLEERTLAILRACPSTSQSALRKQLRVRNARLTELLRDLEARGLVHHEGRMRGWSGVAVTDARSTPPCDTRSA